METEDTSHTRPTTGNAATANAEVRNLVLSVCDLKQGGEHPQHRVGAQLVHARNRFFLFGGSDDKRAHAALLSYEIEKTLWSKVPTSGFSKPSPRYGHSLNVWNNFLILFGGIAQNFEVEEGKVINSYPPPPVFENTTKPWAHRGITTNEFYILNLDNMNWIVPETQGNCPSNRVSHAATVAENFLIVFGGASQAVMTTKLNDMHILNLETMVWSNVEQLGEVPSPRAGHQIVYYPSTATVFLFGGADEDGVLFTFNLPKVASNGTINSITWSILDVAGTTPMSRSFHSMTTIGDRIFIFGGKNSANISDLYIFDIKKQRWARPIFDGNIDLRWHAATMLQDKLLIYGGTSLLPTPTSTDAASCDVINQRAPESRYKICNVLKCMTVLEIKEGATEGAYKFKFVTVGDMGAGKSCLITRFAQDVYSDFHVATIGVDFKSVVTMIRGKLCCLKIWDTAGQERFKSLTGHYYRDSDAFILVYDATRRESFDHIDSWLKQIQQHHECDSSSVKLLIGNKYDLKENLEVSESEGKAYADIIGAIFVATSAKTASNVDAAFLSIANKLVDSRRKVVLDQHKGGGPASIAGGPAASIKLSKSASGSSRKCSVCS